MRRVTQLAGRIGGTLLTLGVLLPGLALAQSATPTKHDTTAKHDSAVTRDSATHTAAGKRSRFGKLGALGSSAMSKANAAANEVEKSTGISKEDVAKAALATTGVGAAAMLVSPDSTSLTAKATLGAGKTLMQHLKDAKDAKAAKKVAGSGATGATAAQQMALYQQQMAAAQGNAMQAGPTPGTSPEMQRLQAEYSQMMMRASAGDKVAGQQMTRFAQEWANAATRIQTLSPDKQQAAYEAAMRDAMACATTGKGCKT